LLAKTRFHLPTRRRFGRSEICQNQLDTSMAKTLGMLFGIVFLAVGILGFVRGVTTTGSNGMPMLL
jgi:hypothetical protein